MIERLSNRLGLMFQKAFSLVEAETEGEELFWEFSVNPHAQQGTVLYLGLMANDLGTNRALSTGLVVPAPSALSQESCNSLAATLLAQIQHIREQQIDMAETSGILSPDGAGE